MESAIGIKRVLLKLNVVEFTNVVVCFMRDLILDSSKCLRVMLSIAESQA